MLFTFFEIEQKNFAFSQKYKLNYINLYSNKKLWFYFWYIFNLVYSLTGAVEKERTASFKKGEYPFYLSFYLQEKTINLVVLWKNISNTKSPFNCINKTTPYISFIGRITLIHISIAYIFRAYD